MMPMVNRAALCRADSPTVASIMPRIDIIMALSTLPLPAKAAIAVKPSTIKAKYSADQNSLATLAKIGAKIISKMTPTVPPANDDRAAIVSALPACP